jgi:hypothetical protein
VGLVRYEIRTTATRRLRTSVGQIVGLVAFLVAAGVGILASGPADLPVRVFLFGFLVAGTLFLVLITILHNGPAPVELGVAESGVWLGPAYVPWPSVAQVVAGPSMVGLRLRAGAPLPHGLTSVVYDPGQPQACHARRDFPPGRVDIARLTAAVRAFAPPDVTVSTVDIPAPPAPTRRGGGHGRREAHGVVTEVRMRRSGRWHAYLGSTYYVRVKPHPVVSLTLPDGRQVVTETSQPALGRVGDRVLASYDADDPTDVRVASEAPRGEWARVDGR